MKKISWILLGSLLVGLTTHSLEAQATPPPNEPLAKVLQALERRGQLSQQDSQRLVNEALLNGAGPRVKIAEHGCLSGAMKAAKQWAHTQGADVLGVPPPSVGYVESQSLPLRAYYETEALKSMAEKVLTAAESAWNNQVKTEGYPQPFTGDGQSATVLPGLWFYVASSGMGGGGYTDWIDDIPMTPIADCSARVVVDSENPDYYLEDIVVHEFNHATQMATDCIEAISAWENFATAVEVNYVQQYEVFETFLWSFQNNPQYPIDYWGDPYGQEDLSYYQYGSALFPIFFKERFGEGKLKILRDMWYSFAQAGTVSCSPIGCYSDQPNTPNWFEGTDNVLKLQGSNFDQAFDEFSTWRAITGSRDDKKHFKAGAKYESVAMAATHSLSTSLPASGSFDVYEYGSRYIQLHPSAYSGKLHVKVTVDPEATWSSALLLGRNSQPVERLALTFDKAGIGHQYVSSMAGVSWAILVVSQRSDGDHNPDDMDYSTTRMFDYVVDDQSDPDAGPEPLPEAGPEAGPGKDAGKDAPLESGKEAGKDSGSKDSGVTSNEAGTHVFMEGEEPTGVCGCRAPGRGEGTSLGALGVLALGGLLLRRVPSRKSRKQSSQ